ncbi:reverse transcriptase domain-containing protein [Mucilaginibacter sp. UYCu711]|uniref:reverse transcriptase domain-containing protein n=1 Tax=Mucilaginibacter sp. UYCu711 TaxID=3156339 RepID=UPI00328D10A7
MRNPEKVLNSLTEHSGNLNYKFERLYRILFNEEMYYTAYQKIYSKVGNMTAGVNEQTIDGMSMSRIEQLIDALKNETYQPAPSRRTYIPKKNGKKRPLGIPSFNDKLLQEVVRMILEAIYEGCFEKSSHGFRPERSCHTALISVQKSFTGTKWFIEGDIKGFFDNINHNVLINILEERIADERFIRLIRKFLNAGYVEDWVFHRTYSGTPQGGIISPILANIYLDKFDKYIKEYISRFDIGKLRRRSTIALQLGGKKDRLLKKLKLEKDEAVRKQLIEQIKEVIRERQKHPSMDNMDTGIRKLKYVRYADDFLIGIIGSKEDSIKVKEDIKNYLNETLKLELSDEKTLITNAANPAKFLGYDVFVRKSNKTKKNINGNPVRCFANKVVLYVTTEVMRKKLLEYKAMKIVSKNGKEVWKAEPRMFMVDSDPLEIINQYNSEIRGFYNYYSVANNSNVISSFYHLMAYSMYATYGRKYQLSVSKVLTKFKQNGTFVIPFTDRKGVAKTRVFYKDGFKRKKIAGEILIDIIPRTVITTGGPNSLMMRLKAETCEYCGATEKLEMHHVRKLKDLKGKAEWEKRMIARNRKTLAVCSECHDKIHAGKLD